MSATATKKRTSKRASASDNGDKPAKKSLVIPPPKMNTVSFTIIGTAAYVQNKFSAKARQKMVDDQKKGSTKGKGAKREPKDFQALYEGAMHRTKDGWHGIPASAFRNACVSACRMAGFKMTHAKLSIFIEPDGIDSDDGTPLVRITKGQPRYSEMAARNDNGSTDIRARPMWDAGWEAVVTVRYDEDQFTLEDVANLLVRAGQQVGIGEGRPDSRKSCGMGWGLFNIKG